MKNLLFFITAVLCLLYTSNARAQQKNPTASFVKEVHEFGKIQESDGPANYQFVFTNTGASPLIISNVTASCGCTTPSYSKEPVMPGAKGFISVSYNPANRPGHFDKTITVVSNGEPSTQYLKITGEVIPRVPTIEEQFPENVDGLRFKNSQITFGNIAPTDKSTQTVEVYNGSAAPITVAFAEVPAHVKLTVVPEVIAPKSKASVIVQYDAAVKNDFGMAFDRVALMLNGKLSSKRITVSANVIEDFSKLTEEQRQNAPKIEFENNTFDFGTIKAGDKVDHNYKFINKGKSDLIIRKVQPACGCTATNLSSSVIKPGETGTISTSFNSTGRAGVTNKTITVITNDPGNSRVTLWIKGTVQ